MKITTIKATFDIFENDDQLHNDVLGNMMLYIGKGAPENISPSVMLYMNHLINGLRK